MQFTSSYSVKKKEKKKKGSFDVNLLCSKLFSFLFVDSYSNFILHIYWNLTANWLLLSYLFFVQVATLWKSHIKRISKLSGDVEFW